MKKSACLLALLWGCLGVARAQVEAELVMDQTEFLSKESVPIAVKIKNLSGQTLHFGTNEWLNFIVEARSGFIVGKDGDPPTSHGFAVETSHVATQHADLAPYFDLSRSGHYTVTATVKLDDWSAEVSSPPLEFDVIAGVKIWEQNFGVPQSIATNHDAPEVRKYILQRAVYLKHLTLYFRVADESESTVYRVQPIGPITSFADPLTRLDQRNNLHVIYEETARTYRYVVFNPNGDLVTRRQYYYIDRPPKLNMDEDGDVNVVGVLRHVSRVDFPPPPPDEDDDTTTNTPPPKPMPLAKP